MSNNGTNLSIDINLDPTLETLFTLSLEKLVDEFSSPTSKIDLEDFFPADIAYYYIKFLINSGIKIGSHIDRFGLMEYIGNYTNLTSANTQINWALDTLKQYGANMETNVQGFDEWWFTLPKEHLLDIAYKDYCDSDAKKNQINKKIGIGQKPERRKRKKEWNAKLEILPKIEEEKYEVLIQKLLDTSPQELSSLQGIHLAFQDISRKDITYFYLNYFCSQGFEGFYIPKVDMVSYFDKYELYLGQVNTSMHTRVTKSLNNFVKKGLELKIEGPRNDTWIRIPNKDDLFRVYESFSETGFKSHNVVKRRGWTPTAKILKKAKKKKSIQKKKLKPIPKPIPPPPPKPQPIPIAQQRLLGSIDLLLESDPIEYSQKYNIIYRDDTNTSDSLVYVFLKGLLRTGIEPGTEINISNLDQYFKINLSDAVDFNEARILVNNAVRFYRLNGLELRNKSSIRVPTHYQIDRIYLHLELNDDSPNSMIDRKIMESHIETLPKDILRTLTEPKTIPEISWTLRSYRRHSFVIQEITRIVKGLKNEKKIYSRNGQNYLA